MDKIKLQKIKLVKHKKSKSEVNNLSTIPTYRGSTNLGKIIKSPNSIRKILLNSSSQSIKDILKTDTPTQKIKEFDQYGKQIKGLMSEYRLESEPSLINKFGTSLEESSKNIKSFFLKQSRHGQRSIEGSSINIGVENSEYKSPLDAVLVLKNNKIIHDNLVKTFLERQTLKYVATYHDIDYSSMNSKLKITSNTKAKIFNSHTQHYSQEKRNEYY